MGLKLRKESYTVDAIDLFRVISYVNEKETRFILQCLQTKTDADIMAIITSKLTEKGYASGDLTPVTWV